MSRSLYTCAQSCVIRRAPGFVKSPPRPSHHLSCAFSRNLSSACVHICIFSFAEMAPPWRAVRSRPPPTWTRPRRTTSGRSWARPRSSSSRAEGAPRRTTTLSSGQCSYTSRRIRSSEVSDLRNKSAQRVCIKALKEFREGRLRENEDRAGPSLKYRR